MATTVGRRMRKATLTEIKEGEEWEWPDPGNLDQSDSEEEMENDELTTEEIFNNFDTSIQDWKNNLELIVSDALKKLKKSGKDKKLMVKYIPGEGSTKREELINPAREEVYTQWKREMKQTIKVTQKRLNKLNYDKLGEISKLGLKSKYISKAGNKMMNDKAKLQKLDKGTSVDLRALFKDMENLYSVYGDRMANRIPVYNIGGIEKSRNCEFAWWKPMCTMCNMMIEYPLRKAIKFQESEQDVMDILKDFQVDYKSSKKLQDSWNLDMGSKKVKEVKMKKNLKTGRRGSNSTQRMMERREKKKYVMKEVEIEGEKRYFLIKKKTNQTSEDAADIFNDWRNNLMKQRQRKPRTRKLSHRAERKQMLKEVISNPAAPKTYAEALKTNLKRTEQPPVEDIFEAFTFCIKRMDKVKPRMEDIGDIFFHFRHNFHVPASRLEDIEIMATTYLPGFKPGMNQNLDCGTTTIKTIPSKEKVRSSLQQPPKVSARKQMKPNRTFTKEIILKKENIIPMKSLKKQEKQKREYIQEEIFSDFIQHLETPKVVKARVEYHQEAIFQEWIHNFNEVKVVKAKTATSPSQSPKPQRSSQRRQQKRVVVAPDYTQEGYFSDWINNLEEPVARPQQVKAVSAPSTPLPTPKVSRKGSDKRQKAVDNEVLNEEVFENFKEDRRHDFNKVTKIKDKKRSQAERRSTGKRVK